MYLYATNTWQDKWVGELEIAGLLSHHFKKVSSSLFGPTPSPIITVKLKEGGNIFQ